MRTALSGAAKGLSFASGNVLEDDSASQVFFIEFVKQGGLFDGLVADYPLYCTSPNAPRKRDVLGTTFPEAAFGKS